MWNLQTLTLELFTNAPAGFLCLARVAGMLRRLF